MGLIGQVKGAKQKLEKAHHVKDPLNYQWVDVDYMAALAQGHGLRMVLVRSELIKRSNLFNEINVRRANQQGHLGYHLGC